MKSLPRCLLLAGWVMLPESAWGQTLAEQARRVLQTHCAACHAGGKAAKGGFGFVLDRDQLVSRLVVVPGKASQSDLYVRIEHGEMPPKSHKSRPSPAELKILKNWIDAGAAAFEPAASNLRTLTEREAQGVILADLQGLDPRRRRFTRYLTLTHLAFAGRNQQDLAVTREAAGKLLNSLAWHPRISLPEPLAEGTILRLDLRAYKWNAALWEKLAAVYPYRLLLDAAEAKKIATLAGTETATVRADWFVGMASRPPLYHDLLQLPQTDRALERLLQVDVPGNQQDDGVQRSGFNDSGVSKNNRLIERHDAAYGVLWRSYDFANNFGRQNLFEHPLGPNTGATSFQAAGGEMIFHLPNGLQAYFLMDAQGRRIDKAPGEIVADPRRPDQRVETGISCMSCHARGLLFKVDQLRGHVEKNAGAFGPQVLAAIRASHPRKAQFQAQIEEDNVRYLKALEKFGIRDPDQEPVNLVTQRFEGTLDGRSAAAEMGLTLEEFGQFVKQDAGLARLFGGLLVPGGTAQRDVFQDNFPELARRLAQFRVTAATGDVPVVALFQGHKGTVQCVAFAPDGAQAASGGDDGTVRIWQVGRIGNPSYGRELVCLKSQTEVVALAYSPDGKLLLTAGRDRLLRLWDLAAGKQVRVFQGHTDVIRCVAFAPDGKRVVSGGDDRSLRIWDIADGREIWTLPGHTAPITSVAWSRDGRRVLSGSMDGTARFWEPARQAQLGRLEGHAGAVLCVAFAPNGQSALTGGNDTTVRLWNLTTAKELHCFKGHANAVIQVQFSGAGQFVSGSSQHKSLDHTWRRWDLKQRAEVTSMTPGEEFRFGSVVFSADGRSMLVGGAGGLVRVWEMERMQGVRDR